VGFGNSQDIQDSLAVAQSRGFDPEIIPILSSTGHSWADSYTGNGFALAAGGLNPEKTLAVLDRIMEDPSYARLVSFGIEGRHWVSRPDSSVALPSGTSPQTNPYPTESGGFWFVNKRLLPPLASWSPAYRDHRASVESLLVPNRFFDFSFVPTRVKTEVAEITNIMAQYGDVISIGAVANVDKAVAALDAQLKAARQDAVTAELRAQLRAQYGPGR
jgi:putative aldouronate transport system substrate-binding protein